MLTKEQKKLILACGFKESRIPNYFYKKWEEQLKNSKNYKNIFYELIVSDKNIALGISYISKISSGVDDTSSIFAKGNFEKILNIIKNL